MNVQQELVAFWQFCEARGLAPSVAKCVEHVRRFGLRVDDHTARLALKTFTAVAPHKMARAHRAIPAHPPRNGKVAHLAATAATREKEVSLLPDIPIANAIGKPRKAKPEVDRSWVPGIEQAALALSALRLDQLDGDQRYTLARFHALRFANCSGSERTNASRASSIAAGIANLASHREHGALSVDDYLFFAGKTWEAKKRAPLFRVWDIVGAIVYEEAR